MKHLALLVLALTPACFFDPSFSSSDAGPDAGPVEDLELTIDDIPAPTLATGSYHACRITSETKLRCWGFNEDGELGTTATGTGTGTPQLAFTGIPDLESGWVTVAAGDRYSCGINNTSGTRKVYCWGRNDLGNADPTRRGSSISIPDAIGAPTLPTGFDPVRIFAANLTTCALSSTGALRCWGNVNLVDPYEFADPYTVADDAVSVAIASTHACLLDRRGVARCWGTNGALALGIDNVDPDPDVVVLRGANEAAPIDANTRFRSLSANDAITCGVTGSGALGCWGNGVYGQLGEARLEPMKFRIADEERRWTRVAVGTTHVCGVANEGTFCYGDTVSGALGSGAFESQFTRTTPINAIGTTAEIAASREFTCAVDTVGEARCWGTNSQGQLGNRETSMRDRDPATVALPAGVVVSLSAGDDHNCAIIDGTPRRTYCWGDNRRRQVTFASGDQVFARPEQVTGTELAQVATGATHSCGLDADGDIRCWGDNSSSQAPATVPRRPWTGVYAGDVTTCGVASGNLYCWGTVPGAGPRTATIPFESDLGRNWVDVSIGSNFILGVTADVTPEYLLAGWGEGCAIGQSDMLVATPGQTLGGLGAFAARPRVYAADNNGGHSCVHFERSGTTDLICFGANRSEQVVPGSTSCGTTYSPDVAIANLPAAAIAQPNTVAVGGGHSCALTTVNQLFCWGANFAAELGPLGQGGMPKLIGDETYAEVVTGRNHTCALTVNRRTVHCWGENHFGQIGDGTQWRPSPVIAGKLEAEL